LDRFGAAARERVRNISPEKRVGLAFQKDALALCMSIAGIDREQLGKWEPPVDEPESFLDGLDEIRLREDAMVASDLNKIPGFNILHTKPFGAVVFQNEITRLTVAIANHLPLEQQLGVDLLYYNERFRSFVFVQYKAMEMEEDEEDVLRAIFRFPQKQLTEEIARMDAALRRLNGCSKSGNCDEFRLSHEPFYLKFCPRVNFNPESNSLVPGIYLPLGLWKSIESDGSFLGPRGGQGLTYANARRYFTGEPFINLVASAWIGTSPEQSQILIREVLDVLGSGRAIAVAVEKEKKPPSDEASVHQPVETGPIQTEKRKQEVHIRRG
jgi:hypothetical protein